MTQAYCATKSSPLTGTVMVPGDKSLSHRAIMLAALAEGESRISGLLNGEDVRSTIAAMRTMGITIQRNENDDWFVTGKGLTGLDKPKHFLDMGNAGTAARLLAGILAAYPFHTTLTGDASLSRRPMKRIIDPLTDMGASIEATGGDRLPLVINGTAALCPLRYRLPVPSAQVKSAVLLAGLFADGETYIEEPSPCRDHTERMLAAMGADIVVEETEDGNRIRLHGRPTLKALDMKIPGDISSAAFPIVAALLVPGSEVTIDNVGLNPHRTGLLTSLADMGASIGIERTEDQMGEPVGRITVKAGPLTGADIPAERAPSMIDEYPILAVAAACATGTTRLFGLKELTVKESNRLLGIANGLKACGATLEVKDDALFITGTGQPPKGGARIETNLDHRMAMAFLCLGLVTDEPVEIDDGSPIATSFPSFIPLMRSLGAVFNEKDV